MALQKTLKVFLDDERLTPYGWVRTFTVDETIALLATGTVKEVSLDNDLGSGFAEGYKAMDWLEEQILNNHEFIAPDSIRIHTQDTVAKKKMKQACQNIKAHCVANGLPNIYCVVAEWPKQSELVGQYDKIFWDKSLDRK